MKLQILAISTLILFISGCSRGYDTYTECTMVEEQKGASSFTAKQFCDRLVKDREIECDTSMCSFAAQ